MTAEERRVSAKQSRRRWRVAHKEDRRAADAADSRRYNMKHREQIAERKRRYYAKHAEEDKARSRAYRLAHRAELAAKKHAYNVAHPEKAAARSRRHQADHREELAAYQRSYYLTHAEEFAAYRRAFDLAHPGLRSHYNATRRARNRGAQGSHTVAEWREKLDLLGGCCVYCGRDDVPIHRDHKVPLVRGGTNDIANIVPACASCNSKKGTRTAAEFLTLGRVA